MKKIIIGLLFAMSLINQSIAAPNERAQNTDAIGYENARHLLNRASFAASGADIATFSLLSRNEAADRLLRNADNPAHNAPPAWINDAPIAAQRAQALTQEERLAILREQNQHTNELRVWWLQEMLTTPSPLTEKMTLFWHGHFATSQQKVRFAPTIYNQNVLLRSQALGNFKTLLHEVSRGPAMLQYLDGANSRKEQPNENFAREVMELFTLGEGHYSEKDIKEAARAFTGWSIERDTAKFLYRRGFHDNDAKTIMGQTGNFDGDQVLDILLAQPQTAIFITQKLWREFISSTTDAKEVARFAAIFRDSGYDIAKLMRAILTSDAFYAAENRASLIKSPVELVVGTVKQFNIESPSLIPFVLASAQLGQTLFTPPNVKGWPGGEVWINSASLLSRKQFIERIFHSDDRVVDSAMATMVKAEAIPAGAAGREQRLQQQLARGMNGIKVDLAGWTAQFNGENRNADITRVVLAMTPVEKPSEKNNASEFVKQLLADPTYQLK